MESPILPPDVKRTVLLDDDTPVKEKPITIDTWSQTTLSFPPVLPPEVEAVLSSYCNFNANQWNQNDDLNSSNSSLSRKKLLFDDVNDDNSNSNSNSCCTTPQSSKVGSFGIAVVILTLFN